MSTNRSLYGMQQAVNAAEQTLNEADSLASKMARLLVKRLRHVRPPFLVQLKKELRGFNAHTAKWKAPK